MQEQADAKEEKLQKLEEKELIYELEKIERVEKDEENTLKKMRAAQQNPLARAANPESAKKLADVFKEENDAVVADKQELAFVKEEFEEGLVRLKAQKDQVKADRAAVFGLR